MPDARIAFMDILRQLQSEHEVVVGVFEEILREGRASMDARRELFEELDLNLSLHSQAEEDILYESMARQAHDPARVIDSYEEHRLIVQHLASLRDFSQDPDSWIEQFKVLAAAVDQHVRQEERDLFGMAREIFDARELEALCSYYLTRKEELLEQGFDAPRTRSDSAA